MDGCETMANHCKQLWTSLQPQFQIAIPTIIGQNCAGGRNEEKAVKAYEVKSNAEIDVCGLFLSKQYPFLGVSPDGIMYVGEGKFALIEVKCPYIHRSHSIKDACQDAKFCLAIENGRFTLKNKTLGRKKNHDYYYQIMG